MIYLVMSGKEENPTSSVEEFATHLSLYDDTFHFMDKQVASLSLSGYQNEDHKGSLPPSVFCPAAKKGEEVKDQVKVKRKCGRPRNPIPRHKRESHINAEHRRRGKIQDGFRTLKNMVPKYEQTSGRDSKADILFKAVDHCRLIQRDISEMSSQVESLMAERDALNVDIKNYKVVVPDLSVYEGLMSTMDDHYADYVHCRTKENWTFTTFKVIMRPLFESYKLCVSGETVEDFLQSVTEWAAHALSFANLRTVCQTTLRDSSVDGPGHLVKSSTEISQLGPTSTAIHHIHNDNNNNSHMKNNNVAKPDYSNHVLSYDSPRIGQDAASLSHGGIDVSSVGSTGTHQSLYLNKQHHDNYYNTADINGYINGNIYASIDRNSHHLNHLMDSSAPWPHQHSYQHSHYYPHLFPHLSIRKPFPVWGEQLAAVNQHVSEPSLRQTICPTLLYTHTDTRDVRHETSSFQQPVPTTLNSAIEKVPYAASAHIHYTVAEPIHHAPQSHNRQKHLSQSSNESDGSGLGMTSFIQQANEVLTDPGAYSQLSPPVQSCPSQGSTTNTGSPTCGGDYSQYNSELNHSIHHHAQHSTQEKGDNTSLSPLSVSLPSYRDTFGARIGQHPRLSADRDELRQTWTGEDTGNVRMRSLSQDQSPSGRYESSSLLAELLGSAPLPVPLSTHSGENKFTSSPEHTDPGTHTQALPPTSPAVTGLAKTASPHIVRPGGQTDQGQPTATDTPSNTFWSSSETVCTTTNLTSPVDENISPSFHNSKLDIVCFNSHVKQENLSHNTKATLADMAIQPRVAAPVSTQASQPDIHEASHRPASTSIHSQVCYFELAHQQLLKSYSLSHQQGWQGTPDHLSPLPVSQSETFSSNLSHEKMSPPVTITCHSLHIRESQPLSSPPQTLPLSANQRQRKTSGRKSSFEESFRQDRPESEAGGCKKMCNWLQLSPLKQPCSDHQWTERRFSRSPASSIDSDCVHKSDLGTLGETTLRFL